MSKREEFRMLATSSLLGYGFPEASLKRGMELKPDMIGVDGGSTDPGAHYLGSGECLNSVASMRRDLTLMLRAAVPARVPRSPSLPNLPTVAEGGVPGYESNSWYGVLVPARTPAAIVTKLNQEIGRIMKMPDVQNKIEALGADATTSAPGGFTELLRSDIERWAKIIPLLGIQLE